MTVTPEILAIVASAAGAVVAVLGGVAGMLAWMWRQLSTRMDAGFAAVDARFARVDARFAQVDARFARLEDRLDHVAHDVNDLKVSVARLEGPAPRLIIAPR